jgi:hypothetical protein
MLGCNNEISFVHQNAPRNMQKLGSVQQHTDNYLVENPFALPLLYICPYSNRIRKLHTYNVTARFQRFK